MISESATLQRLSGGGEMGERIRTHDWAATSLGAPDDWPPGLCLAVRYMLDAKVPTAVAWGPELTALYNDAYCKLLGPGPPPLGTAFLDLWPLARSAVAPLVEKALQGEGSFLEGAPFALLIEGLPQETWFNYGVTPLRDDAGVVRGILNAAVDATRHIKARRALASSERRLRSLIEGIPQLVWTADQDGNWTWVSPQWTAYTGQEAAQSLGRGWLGPVHPDDRAATEAARAAAGHRRSFQVDHRIRSAETGHYRWFQTRAAPVLDEDGSVAEWLGTSTDVEEIRGLERHHAVLLAELQHRVRNTLAVIRSIVRRTSANSRTVEQMTDHLLGRIASYSRVQAIVTRDASSGVDLEELVREELTAHAVREDEGITVSGPPVTLRPRAAETFALALHELATNSVKYGALGPKPGELAVRWDRVTGEAGDALLLTWAERGPGKSQTPARRGFGFELIERTLPYELDARTSITFGPAGLTIEIEAPLTSLTGED
jgi:two-component system CheB/CheR fusion protein